MSAIRPLRDETKSLFARELLESASADRSAADARERALAALGLGAAGILTAGSAAGAGVAAEAATAGTALGAGSIAPVALVKVSALVVAKWVGVGVLGGVVALGSTQYVQHSVARPSASTFASQPQRDAPPSALAAPAKNTDERETTTPPSDPPSFPASGLETGPAPHEAPRPLESVRPANEAPVAETDVAKPADPGTMQQLATLSTIRLLLASRVPARALVLLDDFDRLYPSTPLKEEVTVLRIDALSDLGRGGEASALAAAFLRANPNSAYTRRVRSKWRVP